MLLRLLRKKFDSPYSVHTMKAMKKITWNPALSEDTTRGQVSFENCVVALEEGRVLADITNPNYERQRMLAVEINNYAYVVPYIESENEIFLKTVFPSRKHAAIFLTRNKP